MWGRPSSGWRSGGFVDAAVRRTCFNGWDSRRLPALQGGLAKGPLVSLASPPCRGIGHSLKEQTHQEKLRKGEAKGRSHIYHTSLHDTTLVHMGVRFTCPGRDAEGQEHGLQREKRGRQSPRPHAHPDPPTPDPCPPPAAQTASPCLVREHQRETPVTSHLELGLSFGKGMISR